jgi:hypothetical protein
LIDFVLRENGHLKILPHSEKFEPIYSHMLIKKKKWLSPAIEAFVELVINSIRETDKEMSAQYQEIELFKQS